jgi:hypothetical protein
VSPAFPRCADAARERGDDLVGTAAPARRWLLVEHPGPWAIDALGGSGIGADVQDRLRRAAAEAAARILLVRRPGRQPASTVRSWAVVDAAAGPRAGTRWGSWSTDQGLLSCLDALTDPSPPRGTTGPEPPLLLVCAHGRHDTCCALRGRPVAARLAEHWPGGTWECSHVGGDRFAANLLVLPGGACYGNLDPDNVVDVVRAHLEGRVSVAHLRGISTQPPVGQAAVAAVLRRFGPAALSQVGVNRLEQRGDATWLVTLSGSGPLPAAVEATVVRTSRPPARLTCRAGAPTSAYGYDVPDLRVVGAP